MKKVSKKQFLEELGSVWNESPARSILLARLDYEHIPAETAGIGQAMGSQFRTQQSPCRARLSTTNSLTSLGFIDAVQGDFSQKAQAA